MKILITGASGMVGRALVEALLQEKHQLLTPSRVEMDCTNKAATLEYFKQHQPDFVYHLAAKVGGIQANVDDPVGFFYDNMQINLNVIHAALASKTKYLLNLGSSCMYPRNRELLREEDLMTGELEPTNDGYAMAKLAGMFFCKYIASEYKLFYKTMIPCNLYGEYDHFGTSRAHLIAAIIHKLHMAKTTAAPSVDIWGDGQARREFMHVADLVAALVKALKDYAAMPMIMNVGLGYDYSVNEYYQIAAKIINYTGQFTHDLSRPVGMQKKLVDIHKAKQWGWTPKISIEEGIARVYTREWS
jgi:GDP-L-fucose synthase